MGNYFSGERSEFHRQYVGDTIPEIERPQVEVEVRESTLRGAGEGLFVSNWSVKQGISLGTIQGNELLMKSNDGMMKIATLDDCHNSFDFYNRLCWVERDYHDETLAKKNVNARIVNVSGEGGTIHLQAIRDIDIGEEVFLCYGFSEWIALGRGTPSDDFLSLLNVRNIMGFLVFIQEWVAKPSNRNDPHIDYMKSLATTITENFGFITKQALCLINEIDQTSLDFWDKHARNIWFGPMTPDPLFHERLRKAIEKDFVPIRAISV